LTAIFLGSHYQNVSILEFMGAKDDGGGSDNWSYKTCTATVSHHHQQPTPSFLKAMPLLPLNQQCQSRGGIIGNLVVEYLCNVCYCSLLFPVSEMCLLIPRDLRE